MKNLWEKLRLMTQEKLSQRVFLIRLFITIFVADFIAFMSLASLSPFSLLNPLAFLKKIPHDERSELTLYLPSSMPLEEKKLIAVKQKILQLPYGENPEPETILKNARFILNQLELGAHDLKVRRLFRHQINFPYIWYHGGILAVKVKSLDYNELPQEEKKEMEEAIRKTLQENLPVTSVHLDLTP
ncbi:MAG: hypothetical protein NZM25_09865 [Leptospiraceae bacterium]|nr:hypothetical protein [Leptospiraceae bacterium]MDW8306464.1 hypothetical protein [Leptospiraceae bacterium]